MIHSLSSVALSPPPRWSNTHYEVVNFEKHRATLPGFRHEAVWLRFTDWLDRSCTVYAERMILVAESETLPAILHAVGGGQKVETEDLRFWAEQGYACASFDWQIGDIRGRDPEHSSQWPEPVVAQHAPNKALENCILPLAIQAAQVTLSWLLDDPAVDSERVGMSGISWGGYLTWATAAYDKRIKAICPVYGCGIFGEGQATRPHAPEVIDYWRQHWDPQALVHKQTAPAAYTSGTNDFFGEVNEANRLLTQLPVEHRWSLLPNADHSLGPGEGALAIAWMSHHLKNGSALPQAPMLATDGTINADKLEEVTHQEIWWTNSKVSAQHACWSRGKPDATAHSAFARLSYAEGFTLCSALVQLKPDPVKHELPTIWPDLSTGIGWHWELGSTQFHTNAVGIEILDNGERVRITPSPKTDDTPLAFYLRQIQDPRWTLREGMRLRFQWQQAIPPQNITAHLIHTHPDFKPQYPLLCSPLDEPTAYEIALPEGIDWFNIQSIRLRSEGLRQTFTFGPLKKIKSSEPNLRG